MEVKQVRGPMDFGIENLALPNHLNVSLITANRDVVKANSLVLSYNSTVFKRMFEEQELRHSVDLIEYTRFVIDKFVKILYSGKVDFEKLPFMSQIWKLADRFHVEWLLKQFDQYGEEYATLERTEPAPTEKYPTHLNELLDNSIPEVHYHEMPDFQESFEKRRRMSLQGPDYFKEIRPYHRDEEIATSSSTAARSTYNRTVEHMAIVEHPRSIYKRTVQVTSVSFIDRPIFGHSLSSSGRFRDDAVEENVIRTHHIPNLMFSLPDDLDTFLPSFNYLSNFLDHLEGSSLSFPNMFMFIEFVFVLKRMPCTNSYRVVDVSDLKEAFVELTQRIVDTKKRFGWRKVPKSFILDTCNLPDISRENRSLLKFMCNNEELTTETEAVKIVSYRGSESMNRSRRYSDYDTIRMEEFMSGAIKKYKFFWKHPSTHYCPKTGDCGFILCVVPISNSFDIRLSRRPEDYSDDIHCHPELLDAENMHLVIRRDFSTKGKSSLNSPTDLIHISWQSKPVVHNNQVFWAGQSIPDKAYIALVVYYTFSCSVAGILKY